MDNLILDRPLYQEIVKKKKEIMPIMKEGEKRDKYLDFSRKVKTMEHESDGDTNCNSCKVSKLTTIVEGDLEAPFSIATSL